ncbi:MAG: tetratricopeptide repeat protein [Deltaproteobacteria bacterium]|nr:tetratricopeptide repeat protein [Deltaproteobacteria bacterium]
MSKSRTASEAVDAEDFLYYLYRGSEALAEGRLDGARESLEHALRMQPRDAAAQDLLAKLYFKLGVYPRAIELYQEIIQQYPDSLSPRINIALAYLKTAQLRDAVTHLLPVIERDSGHVRAWGYLGLCWSRLGEHAKAREAFVRAGHDGMAKRMEEAMEAKYGGGNVSPTTMAPSAERVPEVESDEFDTHTLDLSALHVADDTMAAPGGWVSRAPGEALAVALDHRKSVASWAAESAFVPGEGALTLSGATLVVREGCAARRVPGAFGCDWEQGPAVRRRDGAAIAGEFAMHWVAAGWCALPSREGMARVLLRLRDEELSVRESCVLAFDGSLHLEHQRVGELAIGCFVGRGLVVLEFAGKSQAVRIQSGSFLRCEPASVLAWSAAVELTEEADSGLLRCVGEGFVVLSSAATQDGVGRGAGA